MPATTAPVTFADRVYMGDARSMHDVPDGSVDLIVTSPPYFNVKDYSLDGRQEQSHSARQAGQIGDLADFDQFIAELLEVWRECERVLAPNGKLVINTPMMPMVKREFSTHENRHIFDLNAEIQQSIIRNIEGMFLLDTYIWNRTNPSKKLMFGSYPHPPNFYAQNTIEFVTVYVKAGKPRKRSAEAKEQSKLSQEEWVDLTKQVWNIPVPNKSDPAFGTHSALMPEELAERCIKLYSLHGDVVLDPFTGSGTTLRVAKRLGRHYIGYELVPSYREIIGIKLEDPDCCVDPSPAPERTYRTLPLDEVEVAEAVEYLDDLPRESVDLAVVDPPYNLHKADWDTWPTEDEFFAFTEDWLDALIPTLRDGAGLYVFNTPRNCARILEHLVRRGLTFQNWITWDKRDGFTSTTRRFVPGQESILYFTKGKARHTFNADDVRVPYESTDRIAAAAKKGIVKNGKRWFPNPAGRLCPDVWHITSERHKTKVRGRVQPSEHPTPKPLDMIERIILASSNPGDVVLDCFMGTGTTAVAAVRHGRSFVGCERDAAYKIVADARIAEEKASLATRDAPIEPQDEPEQAAPKPATARRKKS